jgi:hypothetical protein
MMHGVRVGNWRAGAFSRFYGQQLVAKTSADTGHSGVESFEFFEIFFEFFETLAPY